MRKCCKNRKEGKSILQKKPLGDIIKDIKRELAATTPLMETLVDLMIISEVWEENGYIHVIAWVPDLVEGKPRYRKKHIIYDASGKRIVKVIEAERKEAVRETV